MLLWACTETSVVCRLLSSCILCGSTLLQIAADQGMLAFTGEGWC